MKKVTIKDIAREAGVSVGLASMVFNGKPGVSQKSIEKVMAVMKRMNYTPNKAAAVLRSGVKKTIGVITPDLANHYFSDISRHIENIAYENGYTVLFGSSDERKDKIASLIDTFNADGIKGILLTPCEDCETEIMKALKYGMKVVLMNRSLRMKEDENVGTVMLDNEKAIRIAIDHLIENGYSRIEMITNNEKLSTLNSRMGFYKQIMAEMGLGKYTRINLLKDVEKEEEVDEIVRLAYKRGTEAILIPRGYLALYVCRSIKKLGLRIPEDLAIIGCDGGLSYRIMTPTVSEIKQSPRETAEESFTMLINMMKGDAPGERLLLEPSLVIGDSTKKII